LADGFCSSATNGPGTGGSIAEVPSQRHMIMRVQPGGFHKPTA
jgi:hypothetical protein